MADLLAILIGVVLVNHLVLARLPAFRAFTDRHGRMSLPVAAVIAITLTLSVAVAVCWEVDQRLLGSFDMRELQLPILVLAIIGAVPLVAHPVRLAMGETPVVTADGLALVMINCAMLGVALLATREPATLAYATGSACATALGFALLLTVFAATAERLDSADVPRPLADAAITLVTAGLLSLAFGGVAGMVRG